MLEDDSIRLRAVEPGDVALLYAVENDACAWQDGCNNRPLSAASLRDYIVAQTNDIYADKQMRLVIEEKEGGRGVGFVDFYDFSPRDARAWLGIMVDACSRGRGYGTRAVMLAVDYAFGFLKLHTLFCVVAKDNEASLSMFQGCGFERCGMLRHYAARSGGYCDAVILQLVNSN